MSTLTRPVPTQSPAPAAAAEPHLSPETRRAALHDLVQAWALDLSPFVSLITGELASRTRPVMVELGCGTGGLALQVMRAVPSLTYYGFDDSAAMLHRFGTKARALQPGPATHFTGPIDLTKKISVNMIQQAPKADVVLLTRFLQTIPMMVPSTDSFTRTEMIRVARQMVRPGGKLIIVEDIYGSTSEEHRASVAAWDDVIVSAAESRVDCLRESLPALSPEMLAQLERHDRLGMVKSVRSALDRGTDREPLPWASWQFLLDQMGLKHRPYRHPALPSLWLIRVEA
ncbi:MAG TPA: class I SAM-dependent methyltransferase [Gemmatimonadales bacterium]|jgi:SAM-dependent methyltransferase